VDDKRRKKHMNLKNIIKKKNNRTPSKRFIEIDLLRGFAITIMVFGHILWDLDFYGLFPLDRELYSIFSKTAPPLFFLLVGMCIIIGLKKKEFKDIDEENKYYKHLVIRGLKIIGLGMILTMVTMIFLPTRPILFGVLHCIGLSIVLSVPFLKYRNYNVLFSVSFISAGFLIGLQTINNPTLFHLIIGLRQADIWKYTIDYFPLFPWFGICLLGIVIGDWLYCGERRIFRIPDLSKYRPAKMFSWIGKHSLGIYLMHQPVIAGVILIYNYI
jgi:uncharacterized membrane protein